MAKPLWTYPSNTNLGILQERVPVTIPIFVFDNSDISDPNPPFNETHYFNTVDSTLLPNYSDNKFFYIKSNGLPFTSIQAPPAGYDKYKAIAQDYVFKIPRNQVTINGESTPAERRRTNTPALDLIGVSINGVPFRSPNSGRVATIGSASYTENNPIYPVQNHFTDGSGLIGQDLRFYYQTDPKQLYTKNPNLHSPIIGYAFDGNPIYGCYGYSNPLDPNSSIKVMKSSYRLRDEQRINGVPPDGTYIEDFIYESGLGDLDQHNGRICRTPEYPGGVYAYFVTVDPDDVNLPRYPYIIGPTYYNEPLLPNGDFNFPGDINLSVISGSLPPGMRIQGLSITGVPFEVAQEKTFRFVLRATNISGISDRTYSITVTGNNEPIWLTPPGDLPLGTEGERTENYRRTIRENVSIGTDTIFVSSVFDLLTEGTVTILNVDYKNAIPTNTKIKSIDYFNRKITLTNKFTKNVPSGTQINIAYSFAQRNIFILDNSYVEYQLSAIDRDTTAGQTLEYYIPPRGGILPPGISLSRDGVVLGFVEPVIAADQGDLFGGNYDINWYDKYAYDYAMLPYNGFDSFFFDNTTYDFSNAVRTPRKLNRYYQFIVRVSDGISFVDRTFRIFVVGDDYFRSDTTKLIGSAVYTADASYLRKPVWLTGKATTESINGVEYTNYYLGKKRANNYITMFLDVYDPSSLGGTIGFILTKNNDGTNSQLPPGMNLDPITGEIYGSVPYQPAITKSYKFTVDAIVYDPQSSIFGLERFVVGDFNVGSTTIKLNSIADFRVRGFISSPTGGGYFSPGTTITAINEIQKTITLDSPLLKALPSEERIVFSYVIENPRTFTLDVIGEIDSTIQFITDGDLGEIPANFVSTLSVEAITNIEDAVLTYTLLPINPDLTVSAIPSGLTLVNDGTIQGKVNLYSTNDQLGLTSFYEVINGQNVVTTFDSGTTTIDREFIFTVNALDQFNASSVNKTFKLKVTTPNSLLYSNIYVKPFLKNTKRLELSDFFTDPAVFEYDLLYRPSDPEFGVQPQLKMLLYAGIETKVASEYAAALGRSYRKSFRYGSVKKGIAKTPGTNDIQYEVVYLEVIDNMENSNGSVPKNIYIANKNSPITTDQNKRDLWDSDLYDNNTTISDEDSLGRIWKQDKIMTADYDGQYISDSNKSNLFGNSVTNIRKNIENLGDTERRFLPLWMRTPQSMSGIEQGFTKAVVLCYCKPGQADTIILNIKNYVKTYEENNRVGFFNTIDFTVDRVIIDSIKGETGDKYIAFAAREVING